MSISIIIKALNEADHIEMAIKSALIAAEPLGGEVILADSGSTDGTIEIAMRFPVQIVQLSDWTEKSCGIGPELGFRQCKFPYVAIIDGDMEMDPDFGVSALAFLKDHPEHAGVSGQIVEKSLDQLEYKRRDVRKPADMNPGDVDRLNSGAVYRRTAIEQAGYMSDRNLHAYEEYDLAVRLREHGWKLHRLASVFVRHHGHRSNPYTLLWRRAKSKYLFGIGELLRAHLGTPRLLMLVKDLREIKLWIAIVGIWMAAVVGFILAPSWTIALALIAFLALGPVPIMAYKYKSWEMGTYAVIAWHVFTYGFLRGLMSSRRDPKAFIGSKVIQTGSAHDPAEPAG